MVAFVVAMLAVAALLAGAAVWASRRPTFALKSIPRRGAAGRDRLADRGAAPRQRRDDPRRRVAADANVDVRQLLHGRSRGPYAARSRRCPGCVGRRSAGSGPDRLVVAVEEHQVLGSWDDGRFVNTFGELFTRERRGSRGGCEGPARTSRARPAASAMSPRATSTSGTVFARLSLVPDQVTLSPPLRVERAFRQRHGERPDRRPRSRARQRHRPPTR